MTKLTLRFIFWMAVLGLQAYLVFWFLWETKLELLWGG